MEDVFHFPAWSDPLDLEAHLHRVPHGPTVKGLFFQSIVRAAQRASGTAPGRGVYATLHDYPLREWVDLLVEGATLAHPTAPLREGLRRLGHDCYGAVAESVIGKILVSVASDDVSAVLRIAPRLYHLASSVGAAEVSFVGPNRAIVRLRDLWDFPDAYQVGIFEGALRALGHPGDVRVRILGPAAADLELVWA